MRIIVLVFQPIKESVPECIEVQSFHQLLFFVGQLKRRKPEQSFLDPADQIFIRFDVAETIQKCLIEFIKVRFCLDHDRAREIVKTRQ